MNGQADERIDERMDGGMDGKIDGWTERRVESRMGGRRVGLEYEESDGEMERPIRSREDSNRDRLFSREANFNQ